MLHSLTDTLPGMAVPLCNYEGCTFSFAVSSAGDDARPISSPLRVSPERSSGNDKWSGRGKIPVKQRLYLSKQKIGTCMYIVVIPCTLLPEACVGGHGYSSLLVCLCVTCESTHLDAIALRLQHG